MFAFVLLFAATMHASAQSEATIKNRFALGGEFKIKTSDRSSEEDYARGQLGPGLLLRFGTPKEGWGFHWMAGYGYTKLIKRYSVSTDVLGGYAFGTIKISDPAAAAYRQMLGVPSAEANATNAIVLKPEIGVWYDVTRKLYVNVNAGYMVARPDVEIATAASIDRRKARADQFILEAGRSTRSFGHAERLVERAIASARIARPHAVSASTCGHSVSIPTPFRKIERRITRK